MKKESIYIAIIIIILINLFMIAAGGIKTNSIIKKHNNEIRALQAEVDSLKNADSWEK